MGITVHYIDSSWKLRHTVLDFAPCTMRHTGENIYRTFKVLLDEILSSKEAFIAICTDNAAKNDVFIQHLLDNDYLKTPEAHIRCIAHIIHLAAQDALNELQTAVESLKEAIKLIKCSSTIYMPYFEECCKNANVQIKKPLLDVITSWNSTYDMLNRALDLKSINIFSNKLITPLIL